MMPIILKSLKDTDEKLSLLYDIHRSIIIFENSPSKEQAQNTLRKYTSYLDRNIDEEAASKLFYLILMCFMRYPDQPADFFNEILSKSRFNSNRIIITASIFSQISHFKDQFSFNEYRSFVEESIQQILNQKENQKLVIFGHQIPQIFKPSFILISILTLVKLKEKLFKTFYPYIFSQKSISKDQMTKFIQKVLKNGLASQFPEDLLIDDYFFSCFSMKSLSFIIPQLSEDVFKQIIPHIETTFSVEKWDKDFSTSILEKIVNLNIKFELIEKVLLSISPSEMKISVWEYLAKFDFILPSNLASQIKKFPSPVAALKVMPFFDTIPANVLSRGLLKVHNFKIYERIFDSEIFIQNVTFSTSKFWNHIIFVASFKEEKCSDKLLAQFAERFINYIPKNNVYKIIESMVFQCVSISDNGINFLCDLLNSFDDVYLEEYFQNIEIIYKTVIESNVIPLPSFWKLFDSDFFAGLLKTNDSDPFLMYAYYFSSETENFEEIKKITSISRLNHKNRNLIIEFINNNNFDFLAKTNKDVLALAIPALIFASSQEKPEIKGLSKETILPFFAISFNYLKNFESNLIFDSQLLINQLINACKYLSRNNSPLLTTSIDSILSNYTFLCDDEIFPNNVTFRILDILIPLLTKNLYKANKLNLISLVFYLSTKTPLNNEMKSLFEKHGINFFKYIIQNIFLKQIFGKLNTDIYLNLEVFDQVEIQKIIADIIQNSTSDEKMLNTIYLVEELCRNVPELKFSNFEKLIRLMNKKIKEKEWDRFLLIGKFLKNQNLNHILQQFANKSIPFSTKEKLFDEIQIGTDELISFILNDPKPEHQSLPFEILFKNLMNDRSISINYFIILFEKTTTSQSLNLSLFLNLYSELYDKYGDVIFDALSLCYEYHSQSQTFVRRTENKKLPVSKIGYSLITKLLNETKKKTCKFQLFVCLHDIVSTFPFLFEQNPSLIFESVLPALNYFFLFLSLEINNDYDLNNLKTAISALEFLFKSLYSVKILNSFVDWFFKNITMFNESQFLGFALIIDSLFASKKVNKIVLSMSIKYNLPKILNELLEKDVSKKIYYYYQQMILILNYFNSMINIGRGRSSIFQNLSKLFLHESDTSSKH